MFKGYVFFRVMDQEAVTTSFEGRYANGQPYEGKLTTAEGVFLGFFCCFNSLFISFYYLGKFQNGRYAHGSIQFSQPHHEDYKSYDGEFKEGLFHGQGVLIWNPNSFLGYLSFKVFAFVFLF